MTDVADDDRKFEMALRLFGKEVVAVALFSNNPSQRWLWMSLGAILTIALGFIFFGTDIAAAYRSFFQ